MDEDIFIVGTFFFTVIVITLGFPLVRAWVRRQERTPVLPPVDRAHEERLARIEQAIETVAVEVERISEGQRFVTRLLADREPARGRIAPEKPESP